MIPFKAIGLFAFVILVIACAQPLTESHLSLSKISGIEIIAENLSEDGNLFSSDDDEIGVFLLESEHLVLTNSFTFNRSNRVFKALAKEQSFLTSNTTLILIEIDEERSLEDLQNIVTKNYKAMIAHYRNYDYSSIERYLGHDDILYAGRLNSSIPMIDINSSHKGDQYHYIIKLIKAI